VFRKPRNREIQEEAYSQEDALVGHIQEHVVTGRYEYRSSLNTTNRSVTCRATIRFHAHLRHGNGEADLGPDPLRIRRNDPRPTVAGPCTLSRACGHLGSHRNG
jgi:hypothetical protein